MANILDYVAWRGDLPFSLDSPNEVDALIFSALSYIPFRGRVLENPTVPISLKEAAADFFASPEPIGYVRPDYDLALLRAAGESRIHEVVGSDLPDPVVLAPRPAEEHPGG